MEPRRLRMGVRNSERDPRGTTKLIIQAFPFIRRDTAKFHLDGHLLNNQEAAKYSMKFFPTSAHVNKHREYIKEHMLVYLEHKDEKLELPEGVIMPEQPVGWIEDVDLSTRNSQNPLFFEALILDIRIPDDTLTTIMAKYGTTSPYTFHYSISYEPIYDTNMDILDTANFGELAITDVKFLEVSLTLNPAFPSCKTLCYYGETKKSSLVTFPMSTKNIVMSNGEIVAPTAAAEQAAPPAVLQMTVGEAPTSPAVLPSTAGEVPSASTAPLTTPGGAPVTMQLSAGETPVVPTASSPTKDMSQPTQAEQEKTEMLLRDAYGIDMQFYREHKDNPEAMAKFNDIARDFIMDMGHKKRHKQDEFVAYRKDHEADAIATFRKIHQRKYGISPDEGKVSQFRLMFFAYDFKDAVNALLNDVAVADKLVDLDAPPSGLSDASSALKETPVAFDAKAGAPVTAAVTPLRPIPEVPVAPVVLPQQAQRAAALPMVSRIPRRRYTGPIPHVSKYGSWSTSRMSTPGAAKKMSLVGQ